MYSVTKSFGLNGLRGFAVAVEADVSGGLPAFSIVGLPDSAVRESADRVRAAIKNLGFKFPDRRITVNLAPADVRKTGPVYDLPLLLAVLTASGQLEDVPEDAAFLGELALDGTLRPVSGVLPMALAAAENGIRALYVPAENAAEAAEACADSMAVYPAHTAREVVDALLACGPRSVVITSGLEAETGRHVVWGYCHRQGRYFTLPFDFIKVHFPGTGDVFSAVLVGELLAGTGLEQAARKAMDTVERLVCLDRNEVEKNKGIRIERFLKELDL